MTAQLGSDAFHEYDAAIRVAAPFYSASDIAFRFLRNRPENRQAFEALMDRIIGEAGFEIQELSRTLWLSADTLSDLTSQGHEVGLHSYDHPYEMATLTTEQQRSQYERNAADIKVATGRTPTSASHPLDSYDERTLALLERMGIRCGFRANMIAAGSSATANRRLEIPREDSSTLLLMAAGTTA